MKYFIGSELQPSGILGSSLIQQPLRRVRIELPWPSKDLHAHTAGGKWTKVRATKTFRSLGYIHALEVRGKLAPFFEKGPMALARLSFRFYMPDLRKRDGANLVQSCKPYIDGCVDAGIIAGDAWDQLEIGSAVAAFVPGLKRVGLVMFTFEELSEMTKIPAPLAPKK